MSRQSRILGLALLAGVVMAKDVAAQQDKIAFASTFPRTLVFIQEEGGAGTATNQVALFLNQAGFPLVEPSLATTPAQKALADKAATGDNAAAVELGRGLGAQVLILGTAQWGTAPNPISAGQLTGTADVTLRAIRLDEGSVVSVNEGNGRATDLTIQAARNAAIKEAVGALVKTEFVGSVANNYAEKPFSARGYFIPDPGSIEAQTSGPIKAGAPKLAIVRTDVLPAASATAATRGIGVVKKGQGGAANDVVVRGIVIGNVNQVEVQGTAAKLTAMETADRRTHGLPEGAKWFDAKVSLPADQDSVTVLARSVTGEIANATAAARIGERWAVVIGVGEYASPNIQDLRYAGNDAQAFNDFLRSDAAGFAEDHILFLKDSKATAQAMREAMFVWLQKAKYNDLVVIYFAGHGAPDPNMPQNLYLLPTDADLNSLAATAFPMWDVKTALSRQIKAERVIVIADACHSGGASQGVDNDINTAFESLFGASRRMTLTAAADNELSLEDSKWGGGHGVFTFNILEALKGAGDADRNGIVTFEEVATYVSGNVKTATNGRQNPQRVGLGDVPLAQVMTRAGN
jgi:hypothetical protein